MKKGQTLSQTSVLASTWWKNRWCWTSGRNISFARVVVHTICMIYLLLSLICVREIIEHFRIVTVKISQWTKMNEVEQEGNRIEVGKSRLRLLKIISIWCYVFQWLLGKKRISFMLSLCSITCRSVYDVEDWILVANIFVYIKIL